MLTDPLRGIQDVPTAIQRKLWAIDKMRFIDHGATAKSTIVAIALLTVAALPAHADPFEGPSFKKGMWHFVRTLDLIGQKTKRRIMEREMTRCVDPTHAMKATFSSGSVGSCVSSKPNRTDNKYTFANRCDFMGRVSTVITVHNEESYTELNELSQGAMPRQELVVARRVGDCPSEGSATEGKTAASALAH